MGKWIFSIPTTSLAIEIPESRLVIEFSEKDAPSLSAIEITQEYFVERNPLRSDSSAVLAYISSIWKVSAVTRIRLCLRCANSYPL